MGDYVWSWDALPAIRGCVTVGVDEVGVGAICGPLVASAVAMAPGVVVPGVRDSKQLPEEMRGALVTRIQTTAIGHYTIWAGPKTVDKEGMHKTRLRLMAEAVQFLLRMHPELVAPSVKIAVDGDKTLALGRPHSALSKGDSRSHAIACASVLAKVTRDRFMCRMHREYPQYGWNRNKGYGTAAHTAALAEHGLSPHHRRKLARRTLRRYLAKKEGKSSGSP